jgi:hypothetical protein
MNSFLALIAGGIFGAILGIAIPAGGAFLYTSSGGDSTAAGVFSFFPVFLVPILAITFAIIGFTSVSKKNEK